MTDEQIAADANLQRMRQYQQSLQALANANTENAQARTTAN
jgi:hypothetical protein